MANYLYNGVELPQLPEWDKTISPYAVIGISKSYGTYTLIITSWYWTMYDDTIWYNKFYDGYESFEYILENGEWVLVNTAISITPIWANFDILNTDGSVFLEASDPVPVGGFEWKKHDGYAIKGNADTYLYNGVELPALPEWDKEKYPYACIADELVLMFGKLYYLYVGSAPLSFSGKSSQAEWLVATANGHAVEYIIDPSQGHTNWTYSKDVEIISGENVQLVGGGLVTGSRVLWCNYDMYNYKDGTLHLAASKPIPVGGETEWLKGNYYTVQGGKWVKQDAVAPSE